MIPIPALPFIYKIGFFIVGLITLLGVLTFGFTGHTARAVPSKTLSNPVLLSPMYHGNRLAAMVNSQEALGGKRFLKAVHCVKGFGNQFACVFDQVNPVLCRFVEFSDLNGEIVVLSAGVVKHKRCS